MSCTHNTRRLFFGILSIHIGLTRISAYRARRRTLLGRLAPQSATTTLSARAAAGQRRTACKPCSGTAGNGRCQAHDVRGEITCRLRMRAFCHLALAAAHAHAQLQPKETRALARQLSLAGLRACCGCCVVRCMECPCCSALARPNAHAGDNADWPNAYAQSRTVLDNIQPDTWRAECHLTSRHRAT